MAGEILANWQNVHDQDTGALKGYINPLTRKVEALDAASLQTAGRTIFASGVPVVLPSSGSVAANGALTLTTNLTLSGGFSWGCYMRFPAGAVFSGSAAGLYFVVMSSINSGTIYNNLYTGGTPSVPDTLVPVVAAGPGAYTQTTSQVTLVTNTITANSMGRSGRLQCEPTFVFPNNANNKVLSIYFGGSVVFGKTRTTSTQEIPLVDIRNRGVANRQISGWGANGLPATSNSSGVVALALDTSADVDLTYRAQLAVDTDFVVLESFSTTIFPFP